MPSRGPEPGSPCFTQWDRKKPSGWRRGNNAAQWQKGPGKWVGADVSLEYTAMHFRKESLTLLLTSPQVIIRCKEENPQLPALLLQTSPNFPLRGLLGWTHWDPCPLPPRIGRLAESSDCVNSLSPSYLLMADFLSSFPSLLLHYN